MKMKTNIWTKAAWRSAAVGAAVMTAGVFAGDKGAEHSVARLWNEELLESVRNDFARPTVHARNLFHVSAAMYDAWAAYDDTADAWLNDESVSAKDIEAARREAISYAAYRVLEHRFADSPGADYVLPRYVKLMGDLGYDINNNEMVGDSPAAIGNRCAAAIIEFGLSDGANEQNDYENLVYEPVNPPLIMDPEGEHVGNPDIIDPNRWQPLALEFFVDQSGNPIPLGYPDFLSPEWGEVVPFSLDPETDLEIIHDDKLNYDWKVWVDPGPPPHWGTPEGDEYYHWGYEMVVLWSSHLDASDGVMWDISPASMGNAPLVDDYESLYNFFDGNDWGQGYDINPVTGEPYEPQIVPRGDYGRILAEFWADGPDSETPPGHWFDILHDVSDALEVKAWRGEEIVNDLEWDIRTYFTLGGAMHDVAVASWSVKGYYDYVRPVSAIRFLADLGQRSDPRADSYHPGGITLYPGYIELVTEESIQRGERHEHLAGDNNENVGKIAIKAWRGPAYIEDEETDVAGVGWILAEEWWPYQRPSFVSPPFAGYVSGHSTYSRAAAWVMTHMTGSEFFPGGLGVFDCPQNEFLVFEDGPSMDIQLQFASYFDASDQCSLSRIWGGIHPPADDIPGRLMGNYIGPKAVAYAETFFNGSACNDLDLGSDCIVNLDDVMILLSAWGACDGCEADLNGDGVVNALDLAMMLAAWDG